MDEHPVPALRLVSFIHRGVIHCSLVDAAYEEPVAQHIPVKAVSAPATRHTDVR